MNTITISADVELATDSCCVCGVVFAFPKHMQDKRRNDGGDFYCPNGHVLVYTKPRIQRLEEELNETRKRLTSTQFELATERSTREKAQDELKRHKKRASVGMCPCCKRQFTNMQRHMKSKHPDYIKKAV